MIETTLIDFVDNIREYIATDDTEELTIIKNGKPYIHVAQERAKLNDYPEIQSLVEICADYSNITLEEIRAEKLAKYNNLVNKYNLQDSPITESLVGIAADLNMTAEEVHAERLSKYERLD